MTAKLKDFWISTASGLVLAALVAVFHPQGGALWTLRVCDGCFVAAVAVLGFGLIAWVRGKGGFDMMGYSLSNVFRLHLPGSGRPFEEGFAEYRERKSRLRRPVSGILLAGLLWLGLALASLLVYLAA